jgi:chaperonin GroES
METTQGIAISPDGISSSGEAFGIAPQWDYVLCKKPDHAERTREGSLLIMPGQGMDKNEALVLAVGPGILHDGKRVPMPVVPGDRVILAAAAYHPIRTEGADVFLAKAGLIIAKVTDSSLILMGAGRQKKDYAAQYGAHHVDEE